MGGKLVWKGFLGNGKGSIFSVGVSERGKEFYREWEFW